LGISSPRKNATLGDGDLVLGIGPTFQFPTASNPAVGSEHYSAGPSAVAAFIGKKYKVGILYQQFFSFADKGGTDKPSVSQMATQVFYYKELGNGWQIGGQPVITYNHMASHDDQWNVPIGFGVQKLARFGKMPVKLGLEIQWSPIHETSFGNIFNIRISIIPIIPALIKWPWEKK
jgi:hypothetical protein